MAEFKLNNLFFALWPDQEVRSELARLQQAISRQSGRVHHPEDLHMTLVFLGRGAQEHMDCIKQAADAVTAEPFTLELDRIGYWKRPRILWCGPEQTPEPLSQLVRDLQQRLGACGFEPEKRTYKPHVTLVRKAKDRQMPHLESPVVWSPKRFVLAGSHSGSGQTRYSVLNQWDILS